MQSALYLSGAAPFAVVNSLYFAVVVASCSGVVRLVVRPLDLSCLAAQVAEEDYAQKLLDQSYREDRWACRSLGAVWAGTYSC